jgi:hypothetical protein
LPSFPPTLYANQISSSFSFCGGAQMSEEEKKKSSSSSSSSSLFSGFGGGGSTVVIDDDNSHITLEPDDDELRKEFEAFAMEQRKEYNQVRFMSFSFVFSRKLFFPSTTG